MTTFEEQNKSADQFMDTYVSIMEEIGEPLIGLNITHFSYNKFIGKDKALILCPQMTKFREEFGYSLDIDIVQPQLEQISQNRKFFFWQNLVIDDRILRKLQECNVNHGFTLIRTVKKDIHESFHFATTNDNEQIHNSYLKNMALLNVFSDYFVETMSDVIDHQVPGKLIHLQYPK